jgi:chromosome segregation ATPase
VKGIPTNPERRVKQAVYLAQRLLEAERQRDTAQAELKQARTDAAPVQKQADVARENLTRAAQPTAYLVNKLRDEENAKAAFVAKCKTLEDELHRCRQVEVASRKEAEQLRERLRVTLQNRGALETLKVMVAQWCAQDDEEGSGGEEATSSDEESDSEDSGPRRAGRVEFAEEHKREAASPASSRSSGSQGKTDRRRQQASTATATAQPVAHVSAPTAAALTTPTKQPRTGGDLLSTAAALGLTPEQVKEMTSPPKR